MLRTTLSSLVLLILLAVLCAYTARAEEVPPYPTPQIVIDGQGVPPPSDISQGRNAVSVAFTSAVPGHLYLPGAQIDLSATVTTRVAQRVQITTQVTSALGIRLYRDDSTEKLAANASVKLPIAFRGSDALPHGLYTVLVVAAGEEAGADYVTTSFAIWNGPLERQNQSVGISYAGPLGVARTWQDLDLFKMAGVGCLRFPLQGWLPQGQALPAEAELYNKFIQEASQRGYTLLATFTPKLSVDMGVNAVQASKEYHESLLAAVNRYSFKVKDWELLTVKPDPAYRELRGIRYEDLVKFYRAMKSADKSVRTIFSIDHPFRWNAQELFNEKAPEKNDILGMRYDFLGVPEFKTTNISSPFYALEEVQASAQRALKQPPAVWITEYGFDLAKSEQPPDDAMQAAMVARSLLMNRGANFERTYWRHNPADPGDLPFTNAEGTVRAKYLALRTTLQMLDGVTEVKPVPSPLTASNAMPEVWAMLFKYAPPKGSRKARYVLATWWDSRDPRLTAALTLKTSAPRITVTDLWGATIDLQPTSNAAVISVNAFPRFVDLGEFADVEISSPFVRFENSGVVLTEGGVNRLGLMIFNDQRLFRGDVNCNIFMRRWPSTEADDVRQRKVDLGPGDSVTLEADLSIPRGARSGPLYDISAEIMLGTRRIAYLTMPVYYYQNQDPIKER